MCGRMGGASGGFLSLDGPPCSYCDGFLKCFFRWGKWMELPHNKKPKKCLFFLPKPLGSRPWAESVKTNQPPPKEKWNSATVERVEAMIEMNRFPRFPPFPPENSGFSSKSCSSSVPKLYLSAGPGQKRHHSRFSALALCRQGTLGGSSRRDHGCPLEAKGSTARGSHSFLQNVMSEQGEEGFNPAKTTWPFYVVGPPPNGVTNKQCGFRGKMLGPTCQW